MVRAFEFVYSYMTMGMCVRMPNGHYPYVCLLACVYELRNDNKMDNTQKSVGMEECDYWKYENRVEE